MSEIFRVFLRLGCLGFGGPLAVMGMMEEEFCSRRKWLSTRQFSQVYALLKIMPGPITTQMAVYLGHLRGGRWGGLLAGLSFILPAFLLLLFMSFFYVQAGQKWELVQEIIFGLQAAALVAILFSTIQLARPYWTVKSAWILACISCSLVFFIPRWEPVVILSAGLIGAYGAIRRTVPPGKTEKRVRPPRMYEILPNFMAFAGGISAAKIQLLQIFWTCFKAGAFVFGTGLAIVPILEADVVGQFHWLTQREFLDGLTMGQITPGPVVITATFIGYKTAGLLGAGVATLGIFLPSFVNVLWIFPKISNRLSGTLGAQGFAWYAIPAVIGGILAATLRLGLGVLSSSWGARVIFGLVFGLAIRFKLPAWLVILIGGSLGAVIYVLT